MNSSVDSKVRVPVPKRSLYPISWINRFRNDEKKVRAYWLNGSAKWCLPTDKVFAAAHKWTDEDEAAMTDVEAEFTEVIAQSLETDGKLQGDECECVTKFFLMWRYRYNFATTGSTVLVANGLKMSAPNRPLPLEEQLERAAGDNRVRWMSFQFDSCDLIVPDCPPNLAYIPLSPSTALVACGRGKPTPEVLNGVARKAVKEFYFQFKDFIPRG